MDLFDLIRLTFLFCQRENFHKLAVDSDYLQKFYTIGAIEDDAEMRLHIAEAVQRLERRVHLATLIIKEEERRKTKNLPFDITDDLTWQQTRFARMTQLIGEKVVDPKNKNLFLTTFNSGYKSQLTYYEFKKLICEKLNI